MSQDLQIIIIFYEQFFFSEEGQIIFVDYIPWYFEMVFVCPFSFISKYFSFFANINLVWGDVASFQCMEDLHGQRTN